MHLDILKFIHASDSKSFVCVWNVSVWCNEISSTVMVVHIKLQFESHWRKRPFLLCSEWSHAALLPPCGGFNNMHTTHFEHALLLFHMNFPHSSSIGPVTFFLSPDMKRPKSPDWLDSSPPPKSQEGQEEEEEEEDEEERSVAAVHRAKRERRQGSSSATMCQVCNIQLNSSAQAQIHYRGKTHQRRLRRLAKAVSTGGDALILCSQYLFQLPVQKLSNLLIYFRLSELFSLKVGWPSTATRTRLHTLLSFLFRIQLKLPQFVTRSQDWLTLDTSGVKTELSNNILHLINWMNNKGLSSKRLIPLHEFKLLIWDILEMSVMLSVCCLCD